MRLFTKLTIVAGLFSGLAVAGPNGAPDLGSPAAQNVELLLGHLHVTPSRSALEAASKDAHAIVIAHVQMEPRSLRRYAALDALAHWPDAQTRQIYTAQLAHSGDFGAQHRAARLLGRVFAAEAVPILKTAWAGADVELRRTLVAALLDAGETGRLELTSYLVNEPSKAVRDEITTALTVLK